MSQVPAWFERKFEFSFPAELYPNLLARLRGTPPRLEEALRGPSHEIVARKPRDKWSAQEHAGHLLDLEALMAGPAGAITSPAADSSRLRICGIEKPRG